MYCASVDCRFLKQHITEEILGWGAKEVHIMKIFSITILFIETMPDTLLQVEVCRAFSNF